MTTLLCPDCGVIVGCEKPLTNGVSQNLCFKTCTKIYATGCDIINKKDGKSSLRCPVCEKIKEKEDGA